MFYEFRHGIRGYLSQLSDTPIESLTDIIEFNDLHRMEELAIHSQGTLKAALRQPPLEDPGYGRSLRLSRRLGRLAFDYPMRTHRLDAIVCPTFRPPWFIDLRRGDGPGHGNGAAGPANAAGYPHLTVPAGFVGELPVGDLVHGPCMGRAEASRLRLRVRTGGQRSTGPEIPQAVQRGSLRGT